jgi:class 3 adenylate cyclase
MPLFMDIHDVDGAEPEDIAKAHLKERGKVFCLAHAPSAEAANQVHREAHGLLAQKIIEVEPDLVEAFLGGGGANTAGAAILPDGSENDRDPGIRTVLFTDIVDSTTMTQQLGDQAVMALIRTHDDIVRESLSASGGREVKHTGDGIMASFVSAASACRCATRIQRGMARHQRENGGHPFRLRIGAAAGEPVEHQHDLFGSTVQLAARLCSHAEPEQILVSTAIADLCQGKGLRFQDLGEVALKGFERPVRAHAVEWNGDDA